MSSSKSKYQLRQKRRTRIRKKIHGTSDCPRLSIFKSSKHIYAQIIDDSQGVTFATASTTEKSVRDDESLAGKKKAELAAEVGALVGNRAIEKGIKQVVFDRGGFLYHGRVKAVSEGARKAGLKF
ncbi:MAG: 50S ribosomal protein L18 [Thermodesulfobacteriota bacterium]|nr:50S ribosomal protein L18 [Thermodesulfobacteriota bacterium]